LLALAVVAGLAWSWWPQPGTYRPIQAYERGTLADGLASTLRSGTPSTLQEGRQGAGRAVWPRDAALPTAESPQLAVVMVPRGDQPATAGQQLPTWVFPFNRPLPPGDGGNQAMAVNTTDGSALYDVAFALVWADGDTVANTNEAYALASCTGCQTVAVAFQVVLIVGNANVVVPENVAAAVNYGCVQCVTQALATQLVVTLSGPLSAQSTAELASLWKEIAAFGDSIQSVPLSELQDRLTAFERRILAIVQRDPAWVEPTVGSTPTVSTTTGPTAPSSPTGPTGTSSGDTPPPSSSSTAPSSSSSSSSSSEPPSTTDPTASSTQPTPTSTATAEDVAEATATP
jgi:putative peptide zinc metalloprotease protein